MKSPKTVALEVTKVLEKELFKPEIDTSVRDRFLGLRSALSDSELKKVLEYSDKLPIKNQPKDQHGQLIGLKDMVMYCPDKFKKQRIKRLQPGKTYRVISLSSTAIRLLSGDTPLDYYKSTHFVIFKKYKSSFMEALENL